MKPFTIYRDEKNEFNEPTEPQEVCAIQGYYHKSETNINLNVTEGGTVTTNHTEKLLVIYDENSLSIKEGDYFTFNDVKYEIIDKGNIFNIIFDMTLERT